ncbi:MAG: hypoxanthine phosphoribosyltransferase [Deltaproteobacteria bacterium]|nr:hypoxanthine phosphoribosyltransferase [Deltaproteobacteria bacterium]
MNAPEQSLDILFDAETIATRVTELGRQITEDYRGKQLTALIVLKGSFIFAADLLRAIELPLMVEFIGLRSYGTQRSSSGVVEITLDVKHPLEGQNVLIVEDIVDTGLTIAYLRKNLDTRKPESVRLVSLLHMPARTATPIPIEYLGFTVPDRFVVGYGLDDAGRYRNLPYIGAVEAS